MRTPGKKPIRRKNRYANGKDGDPLKNGELWHINGNPYYELNNLMYDSSGSRVQFGAGTEENPTPVAGGPAVVTPSRRQRLDHPFLAGGAVNKSINDRLTEELNYDALARRYAVRNTTPDLETLDAITGGKGKWIAMGLAGVGTASALPYFAPGGAFWMAPATKLLAASTLGGMSVDAASRFATGKPWGEMVRESVRDLTGLEMRGPAGELLYDMTNPGYLLSPSSVFKGVNAAQEGATAAVKAVDNATRLAFPKYDLYRILKETPVPVKAINKAFRDEEWANFLATRAKFPTLIRPKSFMSSSDGALSQLKYADVSNAIEQWYYNLMLSGEDAMRGLYLLNGKLNDRVTKGLSPAAITDLMHNTVERNLQTWARNAAGDMPTAVADAYRTAAREALENINVGRYPSQWYKKADKSHILGFKTNNSNGPFISLRDDLRPSRGIEEHEGLHLLNGMVAGVGENSGEFLGQWYSNIIRNPIDYIHRGLKNVPERGARVPESVLKGLEDNVRAALRAIDTGAKFLDDVITAAYDLDFLDIPNWVEKLKGYKHMTSERVTTNRDARKQLFNRFNAFMKKQNGDAYIDDISLKPIEYQNELIDTLPDQWILDAVKNSNGYGQAYMRFLKKNKKITPEKIKLFRDAMKYVGVYGVPLTVGATLFNEE